MHKNNNNHNLQQKEQKSELKQIIETSDNQEETNNLEDQEQQQYYSVVKDQEETHKEILTVSNKLSSSQAQAKILQDQNTCNQLNLQIQQLKQKKQNQNDSKIKEQSFQIFWVIEQNLTNENVAEYAIRNDLGNELLRLSHQKGSLYCLSKIISLLSQNCQYVLEYLDWNKLNLEQLTEENLEFLISNSRLKCLQSLMFKQNFIEKLIIFKIDYNNKIIKKIFLCLDSFCFTISNAEQLFKLKVIDKIFKYISIAQAECYLLIGSLCLSQNAQSEFIQSDVQSRIIKSLKAKNIQLLANSFYALSGICYNQSFVQNRLADQQLLDCIKSHLSIQSDIIIIEALAQFISNLTYNNDNMKQICSKFISELIQSALRVIQMFQNKNIKISDCKKILKSVFRALNNLLYLKSNSIMAVSNNLYELCDFCCQFQLCTDEFFDIITNLSIHQLISKKQVIFLNDTIQSKNLQINKIPQILDSLANSVNHFGKMICQEFKLETYKQILIDHCQNDEIVIKMYRLISYLLMEQENFIYIQSCDILSQVIQSNIQAIQHYYDKIANLINERQKNSRLVGFQSGTQGFFQFEILLIKGNNLAKPAQLKISQLAISASQDGITKSKYIIKKLTSVNDILESKLIKIKEKNKDLKLNLCLQIIGQNESKTNKIILQAINEESKNKIKLILENLI